MTETVRGILIDLLLSIFRHLFNFYGGIFYLEFPIFKPSVHCAIVKWILEAWEKIAPEIACTLDLATDGSEVVIICCFKKYQPGRAEKEISENRLPILTEKDM